MKNLAKCVFFLAAACVLSSAAETGEVKVGGIFQPYYITGGGGVEDSFDVRRARMMFTGAPVPEWSYCLSLDLRDGSDSSVKYLLDAVMRYRYSEGVRISGGQMVIPYSYANNTSVADLDAIVGPLVVSRLTTDRDIGVMADGRLLDGRLYYGGGIFNGAGRNAANDNSRQDFIGRVIFSPAGGFGIGAAYGTGEQGGEKLSRERMAGLLVYEAGAGKFTGEYLNQKLEQTDGTHVRSHGWYGTLTYMLMDNIRAVARFEQYTPDRDDSSLKTEILTLGGRYIVNEFVSVDLNYRGFSDDAADTENEIILQAQMKF